MTLRGRRILLATVAALAGSAFGEQALAVELPPPPTASEPLPSSVPTVDAAAAPALPSPVSLVKPPQVAVASVERAAQDVVVVATGAPLPSVANAVTPPAPAEKAADVQTVESGAAVSRAEPPASRDPSPAGAAKENPAGGDASRAVSPSGSAAERTEASSFLPERAGVAASRPPQPLPGGAAGTALLQRASGGGPGPLSTAALSTPFGVPPDAGTRLIPVSMLLRRTLVTSLLEHPG